MATAAEAQTEYEIMTTQEVADFLRFEPRTVTNLAVKGVIPGPQTPKIPRMLTIAGVQVPPFAPYFQLVTTDCGQLEGMKALVTR